MDYNNNNFVAAISMGSAHITGIVGVKEQDGSITVLSSVSLPSVDFISKGRVFNPEKMTKALRDIREQMESSVNRKISQMYVGVNCMTMRSLRKELEKNYHERITVSPDVVEQFLTLNRQDHLPEHTFLETIPLEYRLGTTVAMDPVGVVTDSIKAQYLNIACHSTIVETIESCFRKAGISIANNTPSSTLGSNLNISATQLANCITTEQERTGGCVVVDMGSETTTVAVYKAKLLRHFAVIPLGANNVTRDIANVFTCDENEAQTLKNMAGYPDFERLDDSSLIHLREGNRVRKPSELAEIIEARIEEIIQNVKAQVEASGFNRESLVNGLYIIGIGSQLKNINKAFESTFKDWQLRFFVYPTRLRLKGADAQFNADGAFNICLALLDSGEQNCCGGLREEAAQPIPTTLFPDSQTPVLPDAGEDVEEEIDEEDEEPTPQEVKPKKKKGKEQTKEKAQKTGPTFGTRMKDWFKSLVSPEPEEE